MAHYSIYRIGIRELELGVSERYIFEDIGFSDEVGGLQPVRNLPLSEGIGFADETGAFRILPDVGISEEVGFSDEVGETGFKFQTKYFGDLQNGNENGTDAGTPTYSDYWIAYSGSNQYTYWDDDLDGSDLDLIVRFRLDYDDFSQINTNKVIWKTGSNVNGLAISLTEKTNNQPFLVLTGVASSVETTIEVNLKNISLDCGVWLEVFATTTKIVLREYDTPSNSVTVLGSVTGGYLDYYESIGGSLGSSPVTGTTGGYSEVSIRQIDYYHIGKIDMPADVDLYPLEFYVRLGSNNEGTGNGLRTGENGTATINADWVTFDGNDAYHWSNAEFFDLTDIDVKVTFRFEEDHRDALIGHYTVWALGTATDGIELGCKDRDFGIALRKSGVLTTATFDVDYLELNTWYEAFISDSKFTIREEATPANGFTFSGSFGCDSSTAGYQVAAASVTSYVWSGTTGSWAYYSEMSLKEIAIYKKGGLTFPSDLGSPDAGPIWRYNWGTSEANITYGFSQTGSPTFNTDNIEGDGNDGAHQATDGYIPKPSTGWGWVVVFSADTFASAQTIFKTGDEVNGAEIGIDGSGNIGFYGRSSSTLTSITCDTDDLSTGTKYYLYANQSQVKIYDSALSLVAQATGTVTASDSNGTQDNRSVLSSVYGSPMSGATNTWNNYFDGKVYSVEWWESDDLVFPPSNWYHNEEGFGLSDAVEGDMNTAIEEATSTIGFTETTGGELISYVVGTSEGLGLTDLINVIESQTHFSESTIGFNESITGEQRATKKESPSTLGFNEETGADHIDENTGFHENEIGFSDTIDAYNTTSYHESESILGLNEETGGHLVLRNKGISSIIGFNDETDAYNATSEHGVESTIGFSDEVDAYNSVFHAGFSSTIGMNDSIGENIEQEVGHLNIFGINDTIGELSVLNVGFSSILGINGQVLGGNPLSPDNEGEIGFDDTIGANYYPVKGFSATFGLDDEVMPVRQYDKGAESTLGFNDSPVAENAGNLIPSIPANATYKFYLTLTGANDSLEDYEVENLKTIQFRMKMDGESSYLGVTAMYSVDAETQIELRPNGTLVLTMASFYGGVQTLSEELMEVDFSDARYDIGGTSASISLNGYGVLTYDQDVSYLVDATYKRINQDGRISYRFPRPDFYLRPGWNAVYGMERFLVDEVSFTVGDNKFEMEVYFQPETLSGENDNNIYRRHWSDADRILQFTVTLTGSQDSVDDYSFEDIFHLEIRKKAGSRSYASVTFIYTKANEDAIVARPNGDIKIEVADGIGASPQELITVNFNDLSYSFIPINRTITIAGFKQINYGSGNSFTPTNVITERVEENGDIYVRSTTPDVNITPGYTITYGAKTFIAGKVSFNFAENSHWMEISNIANVSFDRHSEGEIGFAGASISNIFYPVESPSEIGFDDSPKVSINDEEDASASSTLGLLGIAVAELNPL